jgi:cellulose binding protein with CBM2 domain
MNKLVRIVALLAVIGGTVVAVSGPARAACAGTGTAEIVSLTFDPPAVAAGDSVQATVTAQNCTATAQTAAVQWYGRFTAPGGGIPAGCVAMDPLLVQLTLPAGGTAATAITYRTFASCSATGLDVNVQLRTGSGTGVDTRTATVPIAATTTPPSGCRIVYTRASEWQGGFVADVTVTNTGTAPISGWSVGFTFPGDQTVLFGWNAKMTKSGSTVTAANLPYNRVLEPGAATSFGLQGRWHTSDAPPTSFTLNGRTC